MRDLQVKLINLLLPLKKLFPKLPPTHSVLPPLERSLFILPPLKISIFILPPYAKLEITLRKQSKIYACLLLN